MTSTAPQRHAPDSAYAWWRLAVATLISTISGVGMWSFVVSLPAIQSDFGVARADASLPFTLVMVGFALGSVVMGRFADRYGIAITLVVGTIATGLGYIAAGSSPTLLTYALSH